MQSNLSAKELAYVTAVVGAAPADTVGMAAYEELRDQCMSDIQALGYLHEYESDMLTQAIKKHQPDTLTLAADKLDTIVDRYLPEGRWAKV